jgi:membrane-associated PAP2 superfamily phosphatase
LHVFYIVCTAFFAATLLWDASGLDRAVSQLFGTAQGFALRDNWFLTRVMHDGSRWLAWLILGAMILFAGLSEPCILRKSMLWAIAGTLLAILLVQWLKWISATSCPWDLQLFGGEASFVSHWNFLVSDGGPGRCFPAGHASTAFAFLPAWMALQRHLRRPRLVLGIFVISGLVLGVVQVLRGAHFFSHVMWSGSACMFVACIIGVARTRTVSSIKDFPCSTEYRK